jgi:hypothetical protein
MGADIIDSVDLCDVIIDIYILEYGYFCHIFFLAQQQTQSVNNN